MKISEILFKAADRISVSPDVSGHRYFICLAIGFVARGNRTSSQATFWQLSAAKKAVDYYQTFAPRNEAWDCDDFISTSIKRKQTLRFDMLNLAALVAKSEGL